MFSIPNLFTAANLLSGVLAIIFSLVGRIDIAPFLIFLGAFFDFFDGFLARKLKQSGELGKQLDSLADMVTFGVAPGVLMLVVWTATISMEVPAELNEFHSYVHFQFLNWSNAVFYDVPNGMDASIKYLPFIGLFVPFMSMFRLAKFNLDTRQTDSFIGVPTPLNTIFLTFFPLILWLHFPIWSKEIGLYAILFDPYLLAVIVVGMSLLLVAELPLFSLKFKHFKWKGNEIRFTFLFISAILIPILLVWAIPLIVFLQLILSVMETYFSKKKKKNEI
jgi:CDP-diacylglycerol--serine O-phosphatidyltransferase